MTQHYSNPKREVFYVEPASEPNGCDTQCRAGHSTDCELRRASDSITGGWYWRPDAEGVMPDGDPSGPFDTEAEALADAQATDDLADSFDGGKDEL